MATILMIFLRVLSKKISVALLGGPRSSAPGSLNRLNPRFLRHCKGAMSPKEHRRVLIYLSEAVEPVDG